MNTQDIFCGTQGLKDAIERGMIPSALFHELFEVIESDK